MPETTTQRVTWTPSLQAAVVLIVVALLGGFLVWRSVASEVASPDDETIAFNDAQRMIGCDRTEPIDRLEGPIRGGAATRGVVCFLGDERVHLFEAATIGKWGRLDYSDLFGVAEAPNAMPPECPAQVTIGRGLIVVTSSVGSAHLVEDKLDIHVRTVPMAYPPGSYQLPC